jgi:hypothetical protein
VGRAVQTGQWFVSLSTGAGLTAPTVWAAWDPTQTWVGVQVGDFNGDGKTDIVGRNAATGQWFMSISTGASFTTSVWVTWDHNDPRFHNHTITDVHTGIFV